MSKTRTIVETIRCDICGKTLSSPSTTSVALGKDRWELDLCPKDFAGIRKQFDQLTANGRRSKPRRTGSQAEEEWGYLETLGFKRHRGRKSAAEQAALKNRRK